MDPVVFVPTSVETMEIKGAANSIVKLVAILVETAEMSAFPVMVEALVTAETSIVETLMTAEFTLYSTRTSG